MQPTAPTPAQDLGAEDPYRYGWRDVYTEAPEGEVTCERVPLTQEDVLHPQEGDVILQNDVHDADCLYLACVFRSRPLGPPHSVVTHDKGVQWGIAGIRHHSPDVGVFVGMSQEPKRGSAMLELAELQGRCELVIEVVSPSTRSNDVVTKMDHYYRVGVPFYAIIDQVRENSPRFITAYQAGPRHFIPVELDADGRLPLPLLGLRLGMREGRVACYDAATGEELGDYTRLVQERLEDKRQLAELGKGLAAKDQKLEEQDQAMEVQILARQEAERRARDAEQEVDRQRQEADRHRQARELADRQAEQAAQRIRDLEALVRTLQAGAAGDPGQAS